MNGTQIIFASFVIVGGLILVIAIRMLRRDSRLNRAQDYARLDEVAKKAEAAAARNASLIAESTQSQVRANAALESKVDVLHGLMQLLIDNARAAPAQTDAGKQRVEEMQAIVDERNEKAAISEVVDDSPSPPRRTLGSVTERVLLEAAGADIVNHAATKAAVSEAALATADAASSVISAAKDTVVAAEATVKAAVESVEAKPK